MEDAQLAMTRIRDKMVRNRNEMPSLRRRAFGLGLRPQPWWNADFARWAIQRAEDLALAKGTFSREEEIEDE